MYSDDPSMPFQSGWTEVVAPNARAATAAFNVVHPSYKPGILNCSTIYTEDAFVRERKSLAGNFGEGCHERITIALEIESFDDPSGG